MVSLYGRSSAFLSPTSLFGSNLRPSPPAPLFINPLLFDLLLVLHARGPPWNVAQCPNLRGGPRVPSPPTVPLTTRLNFSISRPAAVVPTISASPTSPCRRGSHPHKLIEVVFAAVFVPASVPPTAATALPPPVLATSRTTVIVTSVFAQLPTIAPLPDTAPHPATTVATPLYTTVTQLFTTVPISSPDSPSSTPHPAAADTTGTLTTYSHATNAVYSASRSGSSSSRVSSARPSGSDVPSSHPTSHKAKNNTGKYVGWAIGGFFLFLLLSSFISAWRKHRKFVRTRPRGSVFIGSRLSDGLSTPPKRSLSQALMHSVSNGSFDAYALCHTPPRSPASVYLPASHQSHPESLLVTRARGYSAASPTHSRPLPQTPQTKYCMNEKDVPVDPHEYSRHSPFGVSSSGSSTGTTTTVLAGRRWDIADEAQ
ncbi:hypothetical protein GGX14DRAFT_439765 [Mycena pura]|uniref:Uncharacterized protein n=1 Tax=Mycena pura TaxID=153505 RepID=A0AAD6VVR0_9AGAR|nr:hypothetical protein GGX14DRAFT_439765 [Mycena pura]